MSRTIARLATLTAAPALAVVVTGIPVHAADNTTREALTFPIETVATCADGSEIGLGFDLVRNTHDHYDRDGNLLRTRRNVNYTGIFENTETGEQYTFQGTRIVTLDYVKGTFTSAGNYRTVTMPRAGVVLHEAGIYVEDLDVEGLRYHEGGPKLDEVAAGPDAVCSLFGLDGA